VSKPLAHELTGYRSAPRGDHRFLIRMDEDIHTVLVVRIDHHADVYRPRGDRSA
jgi:mRNA-degrading endonuclease RelE of RelBE toxin-antitoxin system